MDTRVLRIGPEDKARLRELLEISEKLIDSYTDQELDAAEQRMSDRVQDLLQTKRLSENSGEARRRGASSEVKAAKTHSRFRWPLMSGVATTLVAAAAVMVLQMKVESDLPPASQLVSKGAAQGPALACEFKIIMKDGETPDDANDNFIVPAQKSSYLKLYCGQPVHVHIGVLDGETLHLELKNLQVSAQEKLVLQGSDPVDFTALLQKYPQGLMVLVSPKPLTASQLSPHERTGLWLEELPLRLQP